jgi:Lrp/AsnC family leucine-responsive transcriptional regulator
LPKIDEIDAKILSTLLLESRTSFTKIAQDCGITVGAVRMRYKRLWREGIVNGEVTLINPHCLGYRHIVDLGIITDQENEKDVANYLETKLYISQLVTHLGKYNFYGKVALRDLNRLSEIIEDLESNEKIRHVDALVWAEAINAEFPQNLVIKPLAYDNSKNNRRPALTNIDQAPVAFDDIDRKIARILSKKSRTPFRQIAEELDVSTKTIIQRYKKLRQNLLTLSTITLDLSKIGYRALANIYLKVSNRSKMTEIYGQLLQIPNVIVIIRMFGNYDLYVVIALEDFDRMFEVSRQIHTIHGLEKPEIFIVPQLPAWPLNLFPSLIEGEVVMPKYWLPRTNRKNEKYRSNLYE